MISKRSIRRMFGYVLLIPLLVGMIIYIMREPTELKISSLGNELSGYFYSINSAAKFNDYARHNSRTRQLADKKLVAFYKKWHWQKNDNLIDYKSTEYETWRQVDSAGKEKPNYLLYWQTIRPFIKSFYAQNLEYKAVAVPVVHFRCSDVPFTRDPWYNLSKRASVQWMAQQIKQRGFDEIILISCNMHKSFDKANACAKYTNYYANVFMQEGVKVTTQCGSIYDDFVTMVHSPILVSLNSSSYSFMAGIAKDPHNYISCNMGINLGDNYYAQTAADWILDPRAPLLHTEVKDYYDAEQVIKIMDDLK